VVPTSGQMNCGEMAATIAKMLYWVRRRYSKLHNIFIGMIPNSPAVKASGRGTDLPLSERIAPVATESLCDWLNSRSARRYAILATCPRLNPESGLPTSCGTSDAESLIGASIPKNYKITRLGRRICRFQLHPLWQQNHEREEQLRAFCGYPARSNL
jgi:hypothetical protein